MKLEFLEQTLCDFKSFEEEHTLEWDLPGVTFVCGDNKTSKRLAGNGSGKSSLFDGFCWCLFGTTPGGLRNPDIMPWSKSGSPSVSERIRVDGVEHTVTRTAKPNQLYIDGVEVSQERLEELLGLNLDLFTNTLLLAQGQPLFFDRTPKDKMSLFSDTLQLDRWDAWAKAASDTAAAAEEKKWGIMADQAANTTTAAELDSVLEGTRKRAETWVVEQRVKSRDAKKRIGELEEAHAAKDKQLATALLAEDGAATEHAAVQRERTKLAEALGRLQRDMQHFEDLATVKHEQCRTELKSLSRAKVCPTCGQDIKAEDVTEHKAHLEAKLEELVTALENAIPPEMLKLEESHNKRMSVLRAEEADFKKKLDLAQTAVRRLQPEVSTLKAQLTELRRALNEDETNPHTAQIATLLGRLKALKAEKAELGKELAGIERAVECNKFWVKGFKDIKLQLIADVLDELELATNSMLEEVGLVGWEVRYSIERETKSGTVQRALSVEISSLKSKGFVKWESWSGGEKQRLRLVGALALADVLLNYAGVQTNLEILDEPAVYWSSEGVQELCAFLAERARQTDKSIFYVEHNAVESVHFSQKLTVVHDKDGSHVKIKN